MIRRGPTQRMGIVILVSGWSGESALVRLLAAGGRVRIVGQVLAEPVRQPARHLRSALSDSADGRVFGVLVQPHHIWLRNQLDADQFVSDLVADGIGVLSLHRASHEDRGLSRALCGPRAEVLPVGMQIVDPGEIAVFAKENEYAAEWFGSVVPESDMRLVFEQDLVDDDARRRCLERLAARFTLPASAVPSEPDLPVHETLWSRVVDPAGVRREVASLVAPGCA
jgi:hypothetical protein